MTTQTNTIINKYKSEGANKVVKDTERVGRAQTRLGQASASSGRQFAAQASGLGGLVAAYAGAAATVFALQAAFDALARAARAETIVQGTKTLALEIGQSGPKILAQVQKITQGQLELSEAAQNVNIALSSGFNSDQIERLTAVSLGASRALGRNLTDSLQRVVRGAAKLEPELLDELGIFTRIDPAVEAYASKLNIAATQLTNFERRQAFVNAVIEEGEKKFSNIDTVSGTTQKSLEQLQASIQTLAIQFGQLIADVLQPVVNFFKNDFGNVLLVFGGILTLVFGKAISLLAGFVGASLNATAKYADDLAARSEASKKTTQSIIADQEQLNKAVAARPPSERLGGEASFQRGLTRDVSSKAAAARRRFLSGETLTPKQRAADVKVLTQAQNQLADAGRKNSKAFSDAKKITDSYTNAAKNATLGTKALNLASITLTGTVRALGAAFVFLNRALVIIGTLAAVAQLVGQLIGKDVIGAVAEFLGLAAKNTENLTNGIIGLGVATGTGSKSLESYAKSLGASQTQLENLRDTVIDTLEPVRQATEENLNLRLLNGVNNAIVTAQNKIGILEAQRENLANRGRDTSAVDDQITRQKILIEELQKRAIVEGNIISKEVSLFQIERERTRITEELQTATGAAATELQIQLQILRNYEQSLQAIGPNLELFVGQLSAATGIPTGQLVETLSDLDSFALKGGESISVLGLEIKRLGNRQVDLNALTEAERDFVISATIAEQTLKSANEAFDRGATSAEKLSQQVSGVKDQLISLQLSGKGSKEEIAKLNDELDRLTERRDTIRTLENLTKGIRGAFGGDVKALDTAVFKGLVDSSGKVAANTKEISNNQFNLLQATFETTKEFKEQVNRANRLNDALARGEKIYLGQGEYLTEQIDLNQEIVDSASLNDLVVKATAGRILDILQTSEKIIASEKIREIQLQNQLDKIKEQTDLLQLQNNLAQDRAIQKAQIEALERSVNVDEKRFDLAKQITKANEDQFTAQQKLNDLKNQEFQIQRDIADIQFQTQLSQAEAARGTESAQLASSVARQLEDPRTTSREAFDLRKSLLDLERAQADDIQREQVELAERTYQNELAVIGARKVQLLSELDNLETKTQQAQTATLREKELLDQRQAIEIQKINNERDLLKQRLDVDLKTAENALDDIDRREALFEAQNNANAAVIAGFESFFIGVNELNGGAFVAAVKEYLAFNQQDTSRIEDAQALGQQFIEQAQTSAKKAGALLESNAALQGEIFDAERTNATSKLAQISNIFAIEDQALANKLADTETLQKIERDALAQTQLARLAEIEAQRKQIQQQLSNEDLLGQKAYEQLQAKLLGLDIERAATEDALDLRLQSLEDEYDVIRQLNFEIAGIVSSGLTDAFMDLNTAFIEGTLTFKGVADGFRDLVGSMLREIQAAVFRETIVNPLVGSIVSAVPVFGTSAASGGRIEKKASGGLLRDRVPALLEPGEFVVSRRGAKAIGLANLQEINSGISDDAESILLASLFSKKVKGMANGGPVGKELQELEAFGLGSEGIDPLKFIPYIGRFLPESGFRIGKKAPPRPSSQKVAKELQDQLDEIEEVFGVQATRTKGFIEGAIDPVTGGIFGKQGAALTDFGGGVFGARTAQGTASFTGYKAAIDANISAFNQGLFRSTPLSLAEYNAASPTARYRFNPQAASIFGGGPALSINQAAQLSQFGGYRNFSGGYTIPSGTFSGTIGDVNLPGGNQPNINKDNSGKGAPSGGGFSIAGIDFSGDNIGLAAGGLVKMAAGGMMRDRVPALLEPGEFVIRRPAAKAIGGAALGAMNATGKATPNIAVNVNNQGVPKNVSVAPPRINGDKIILDIITRDLRNNGAIKKTMRRGK